MIAAILSLCSALAVPPPAARQLAHDNVVILLDASGSMEKSMGGSSGMQKMDAAKHAIAEVLQRVPGTTQAGLLVFSGRNKRDDWVFPLGPRDDQRLIGALNSITADGGTPLGTYLKIAADRLLEQRKAQSGYGTYRMLVVTDGQADKDDVPNLDRYLPDILARGIVVDVIGVAMDEEHQLARRVHSYRRADDLSALRSAISEVFAEVGRDAMSAAIAAEGFELVAGLPDEAVLSILDSLTRSDDEPIGTRVGRAGQAGEGSGPAANSPDRRSSPGRSSGGRGFPRYLGLFFVLLVVLVVARRRRRMRR